MSSGGATLARQLAHDPRNMEHASVARVVCLDEVALHQKLEQIRRAGAADHAEGVLQREIGAEPRD